MNVIIKNNLLKKNIININKKDKNDKINKKEIDFINEYNCKCPNGYNMVEGGSTEFINSSFDFFIFTFIKLFLILLV